MCQMASKALIIFAYALLLAWPAGAQFSLERQTPAMTREGVVDVESAALMKHLELQTLVALDFALNPLVLREGNERHLSIISQKWQSHLNVAVGLFEWVDLGLAVPATLLQFGDALPAEAVGIAPEGIFPVGLGDLLFVSKVRILRQQEQGADLAFALSLSAPSALPSTHFLGSEGFTFRPRVLLSKNAGPLRFASQLSYWVRPQVERLGAKVGHEIQFKGGIEYDLRHHSIPFRVGTSIFGALPTLPVLTALNQITSEWRVSGTYDFKAFDFEHEIFVQAATGLLAGIGTPDVRVVSGWRLRRDFSVVPERDLDQDGVMVSEDRCPNVPEDLDGFEDEDGCPDIDDDQDGIVDDQDQCKNAPEDVDGFRDEDGCPELDNDEDGILDDDDLCPMVPATEKDGDGCPKVSKKPAKKG